MISVRMIVPAVRSASWLLPVLTLAAGPARAFQASGPLSGVPASSAPVDEAYLQRLDRQFQDKPSPETQRQLVQAYSAAASSLSENGDPDAAIEKYRHALSVVENEPALTIRLANVLLQQKRSWEAAQLLQPLVDARPESASAHVLLGSSYYAMEDLDRALAEWKKALALGNSADLREAIERAQREQAATGSYRELRSAHFVLRYDEDQAKALANEILPVLEDLWGELRNDFDTDALEPVTVFIYPRQAYQDITRVPGWAGAVNDGKIRLPVSGLAGVTPEVRRILKHELTHSFVRQITQGRCPQWFNEGLAQLEEGPVIEVAGNQPAQTTSFTSAPAFSALEGSFMSLSAEQAQLAYQKSLAALQYLRETVGMPAITSMLREMAGGMPFGSILERQLHTSYGDFERNVESYWQARRAP